MAKSELQHELNKQEPFDTAAEEAVLSVMRTESVFAVRYERFFREHGLTSPQYNILRILRGHKGQGLPSLTIASQMVACVPDITRLIDRLVKAGYVERERSTEDRRVVHVRITNSGKKLLAKLDQPVRDNVQASVGHMTKKELNELIRLLAKARQSVSDDGAN